MTAAIDHNLVRRIIDFCPSSGVLTWKVRGDDMFSSVRVARSWNSRYSGSQAFTTVSKFGYLQGSINGKNYQAHRVAYAHFYGLDSFGFVDHIDGVKTNNSIENLRIVTHHQNMQNVKKHEDGRSMKGAYWRHDMMKWESKIMANGVLHRLGFHDNEIDAHEAYCRASSALHGNDGRFK